MPYIKKIFIAIANFFIEIINRYKLGLCNKYFGYNPEFEKALDKTKQAKDDEVLDKRRIKFVSYSKLLLAINLTINGLLLFLVLESGEFLTDIIDEVFTFFQFKAIFKFEFLNRMLYSQIATVISYAIAGYIILALLIYVYKALFSLTVVMEDEIAYVQKKFLKTVIVRIPAKKAYYIAYEQNIVHKIIGCGHIIINFANNTDYVRISGIPNVKQIISRIFGRMNG